MLWKLAWKNIWRNKLRSGVILGAILIGLATAVFLLAFANGMITKKINDAVDVEMSQLSVNSQNFIDYSGLKDYFTYDIQSNDISKIKDVVGVSPRIVINSSVATIDEIGGVQIIGIYPQQEKNVSLLYKKIPKSMGVYLNDSMSMAVVVGEKFALKYKTELGSKIVVTLLDTNSEEKSAEFSVCGIYKGLTPAFEETKIFVREKDLRSLALLKENTFHQINIKVNSNQDSKVFEVRDEAKKILGNNVIIRSWKEINPIISVYTDFGIILYAMVGIILFALGFGIVNTVLMSVVERQKEFNILTSIGMKSSKIIKLVILEGTLLTFLGGIIGMIIGLLLVVINKNGIDMSSSMGSYSIIGIDTMIVPSISITQFLVISLMVILTGIISSIYPAKTAIKWRKL